MTTVSRPSPQEPPGASAGVDVFLQEVNLDRLLVADVLHQVPYGNQSDEPLSVDDGEVPAAMTRHLAHRLLARRVGFGEDEITSHDLRNRGRLDVVSPEHDTPHEV